MYTGNEIIETINMVSHQHLDVRTITMGISLSPTAYFMSIIYCSA